MVAATRQEISHWFDQGVTSGAKFLIIICDTHDYEDHPFYAHNDEECLEKLSHPGDMERIMEVYDLSLNKEDQLAKENCMSLQNLAQDRVVRISF